MNFMNRRQFFKHSSMVTGGIASAGALSYGTMEAQPPVPVLVNENFLPMSTDVHKYAMDRFHATTAKVLEGTHTPADLRSASSMMHLLGRQYEGRPENKVLPLMLPKENTQSNAEYPQSTIEAIKRYAPGVNTSGLAVNLPVGSAYQSLIAQAQQVGLSGLFHQGGKLLALTASLPRDNSAVARAGGASFVTTQYYPRSSRARLIQTQTTQCTAEIPSQDTSSSDLHSWACDIGKDAAALGAALYLFTIIACNTTGIATLVAFIAATDGLGGLAAPAYEAELIVACNALASGTVAAATTNVGAIVTLLKC